MKAAILTWLAIVFAVALPRCDASADAGALTPTQRRLALALARVAWNESAGNPGDVEMIYQVARDRTPGGSPGARLAALRNHSPCATGVLSIAAARARPGQCSRSRSMPWDGRGVAAQDRARWAGALRKSVEVVALGDGAPRQCQGRLYTWGGPQIDAARIRLLESRGGAVSLCKVATENTAVRWDR